MLKITKEMKFIDMLNEYHIIEHMIDTIYKTIYLFKDYMIFV